MTLQLKEEARKEFDNNFKKSKNFELDLDIFSSEGNGKLTTYRKLLQDFIDSLITKAYEEGKRELKNELLEIHKKNMDIGEDYQYSYGNLMDIIKI